MNEEKIKYHLVYGNVPLFFFYSPRNILYCKIYVCIVSLERDIASKLNCRTFLAWKTLFTNSML